MVASRSKEQILVIDPSSVFITEEAENYPEDIDDTVNLKQSATIEIEGFFFARIHIKKKSLI